MMTPEQFIEMLEGQRKLVDGLRASFETEERNFRLEAEYAGRLAEFKHAWVDSCGKEIALYDEWAAKISAGTAKPSPDSAQVP